MQVYTIHMRRHGLDPHKDIVFVREGFSWLAAVFTFLWAAYHRLWLMMIGILVLFTVTGVGLSHLNVSEAVSAVIHTGLAILVGYCAYDLRRRSLARTGFAELDVVIARDQTSAEQRYFDMNPSIASLITTEA